MSFLTLPDEMKLNVLQYSTGNEIKKMRTLSKGFLSDFVKLCTNTVKMDLSNNLSNMMWIKDRYNGDTRWHSYIKFGMFCSL